MKEPKPELIEAYNKYVIECKTRNHGPDSFAWWCFLNAKYDDLRPHMMRNLAKNKEFIDSQAGTVWTPTGRVKMEPEYVKRAEKLRAFQKEQREADPEWMADDRLQKRLQNNPTDQDAINKGIYKGYCSGCAWTEFRGKFCAGPHILTQKEYLPDLEILIDSKKKGNRLIIWLKRKKRQYDDRRRLKNFRSGK